MVSENRRQTLSFSLSCSPNCENGFQASDQDSCFCCHHTLDVLKATSGLRILSPSREPAPDGPARKPCDSLGRGIKGACCIVLRMEMTRPSKALQRRHVHGCSDVPGD